MPGFGGSSPIAGGQDSGYSPINCLALIMTSLLQLGGQGFQRGFLIWLGNLGC